MKLITTPWERVAFSVGFIAGIAASFFAGVFGIVVAAHYAARGAVPILDVLWSVGGVLLVLGVVAGLIIRGRAAPLIALALMLGGGILWPMV